MTADYGALLADLAARREQSQRDGQVNNSALYAGEPMYYYCDYCGVLTEVKPETWWEVLPRRTCDACQVLIDGGRHDGLTPRFPYATVPPIDGGEA